MSPIHDAARAGLTKKVLDLLSRGYGLEDEDRNGHTPLHYACIAGDLPTVKALVSAGASLNARTQVLQPPSPPQSACRGPGCPLRMPQFFCSFFCHVTPRAPWSGGDWLSSGG